MDLHRMMFVLLATAGLCMQSTFGWAKSGNIEKVQVEKSLQGYCCDDGRYFVSTESSCKARKGAYYPTRSEAGRNCKKSGGGTTSSIRKPPVRQGYCCDDGEIKKTTESTCLKGKGKFFTTRKKAEQQCGKTRGYCCDEGNLSSSSKGQCDKVQGIFEVNRAAAQRKCNSLKGYCCSEGDVFSTANGQCLKKKGSFFTSRMEAESNCRAEKGYCCINGKTSQLSQAECARKRGTFYVAKAQAIRNCSQKTAKNSTFKGFCCSNGKVTQTTYQHCLKVKGAFHSRRADAQKMCRPAKSMNKEVKQLTSKSGSRLPVFSEHKRLLLPDLVIFRTWIDKRCLVHVDIRNDGGPINDNDFNKARVHIAAGADSTLPKAKQYLKFIDPGGKLKTQGGSISFNSGLSIRGSSNTLVWLDTQHHIQELNEQNNGDDQPLVCGSPPPQLSVAETLKNQLTPQKRTTKTQKEIVKPAPPGQITQTLAIMSAKGGGITPNLPPEQTTQSVEIGLSILSPTAADSFMPGDSIPIRISFDGGAPTAFVESIVLFKGSDMVAIYSNPEFPHGEPPAGMVTEGSIPSMAEISGTMSMSLVIPNDLEETGTNFRIALVFDRYGPRARSDNFRIGRLERLELPEPLQATYFRGVLRANDSSMNLHVLKPAAGTTVIPGQEVELYTALLPEEGSCGTHSDVESDNWSISLVSYTTHSNPIPFYSGQLSVNQRITLPSTPEYVGQNVFLYVNNISGKNCYGTSGILHMAETVPLGGSGEVDPDWVFMTRPRNREVITRGSVPLVQWQVHPLTLPKAHFFKSTLRAFDGASGEVVYPLLDPCYHFNEASRVYTLNSAFSLPYHSCGPSFSDLSPGSYELCLEMIQNDDSSYTPAVKDCRAIRIHPGFSAADISFRTVVLDLSTTAGRNIQMQLLIPDQMVEILGDVNSQQIILNHAGSIGLGEVLMTTSHRLADRFTLRLPTDGIYTDDYELIMNIRMGDGSLYQVRSNPFHVRSVHN